MRVRLGVVGLSRAQVSSLNQAIEFANGRAPLTLEVHEGRGELALVDSRLAADLSAEEWETLFGQAPVVAVVEPGSVEVPLRTPYRLASHFDDEELLTTLGLIPELRQRGLSRLRCSQQPLEPLGAASTFVADLLRGYGDRQAPVLLAGYDHGASLLVDFERHQVIADDSAWERLRAQRELPRRADGTFRPVAPAPKAKTQGLDALVWSTGLAAGALPLLGAPAEWRDAPIRSRGWLHLRALSRMPVHLHLAELIAAGGSTPERLRRATRADVRELRAFLQAGLFLQALEWGSAG
jgi:hypothetical protein